MSKKIKIFINNYYGIINTTIGSLTILFSSFFNYKLPENFSTTHPARNNIFVPLLDNIYYIFGFSLFLLIIVNIIENLNRKNLRKLEEDNQKYKALSEKISENIKELFDGFLYKLATSKADFSTNERVTLYIYNGDCSFIPFGRYSTNPKYAKTGRTSYPDNQGCIAKGWEETWFFYNDFSDSKSELDKYVEENKNNFNMDKSITKKLKMKPTSIAVLRLDINKQPKAVIVVESTNKNKYTEKQIKTILEEQKDYIIEMIKTLEEYIPKPSNAKLIEEI